MRELGRGHGRGLEAGRAGGQGHEATLLLALSRPPSCLLCPALPLPPAFAQVASRSSAKRSLRRRSLQRRSHYYGVSRPEGSNRWQATKRYNGKVWMASFDTEEQAARQYDTWARQCYGQRAIVNFPAEVEQHPPRWQSQSRWVGVLTYGGVWREDVFPRERWDHHSLAQLLCQFPDWYASIFHRHGRSDVAAAIVDFARFSNY